MRVGAAQTQRCHDLETVAAAARLVIEEDGVLRDEFTFDGDGPRERALFVSAPRLPVAQRDAGGACSRGEREGP